MPFLSNAHALLRQDALLTMYEVAALLHVPLYTARQWGREGVYPSLVIKRRRFVRAVAFHRWLKEREHGGRNAKDPR